MVEAFRSLGVEAVPGPGNIFDPEVHEAIMREENDDLPDGTVLQACRRGFRRGNQRLRAAMVQVQMLAPTMPGHAAEQRPDERLSSTRPHSAAATEQGLGACAWDVHHARSSRGDL